MSTLFVVGTPIGNLGDITERALSTLRAVEHVAAEDTRRTRALLSHFEIRGKRLLSLDANASERRIDEVLEVLEQGQDLAFATDAGMPSLSDPGARLVRRARERGHAVTVLPGPSALTAAVALSGLVDAAFLFVGFFPRHGAKRRAALERALRAAEPCVFFESPRRIKKTLGELAELDPERPAVLCREITKLHEQCVFGSLAELAALPDEWQGEITVVCGARQLPDVEAPERRAALEARIREGLAAGSTVKTLVEELGPETELPRRELYALVQRLREALPGDAG